MIDTLRRAFNKYYEYREDPSQIWIAFIYVPNVDKHAGAYHHAMGLAERFKMRGFRLLQYEYIFEWEIPQKYFIHEVSVKTLMQRGFNMSEFLVKKNSGKIALRPIPELKNYFARTILESSDNAHEVGIYLGLLARCFGARSPSRQITLQLQQDCFPITSVNHDDQVFRLSYEDGSRVLIGFDDVRAIEDGVDVVLLDWWLTDPDFCAAYEDHLAWAEQTGADVESEWELHKTERQIEKAAVELGL